MTNRHFVDSQQHPEHSCSHCGKRYTTPHLLDAHQHSSCVTSKRGLSELLLHTREHWRTRKKRKVIRGKFVLEVVGVHTASSSTEMNCVSLADNTDPQCLLPSTTGTEADDGTPGGLGIDFLDQDATIDTPLALDPQALASWTGDTLLEAPRMPEVQTKNKRTHRTPARYKQSSSDQPAPSLGTPGTIVPVGGTINLSFLPASLREIRHLDLHESEKDVFGILKRYRTSDGAVPLSKSSGSGRLTSAAQHPGPSQQLAGTGPPLNFGPFPNQSGFLLAEWYWGSTNKSFADFQKLMAVLKQPSFSVGDATSVNWTSAFKALGSNQGHQVEDSEDPVDDGWKSTPLSINIPFHSLTKDPGTKPYVVGTFRHRSLVSVIKEKLSRQQDHKEFNYYPYTSAWKPTETSSEVELYGELYASRAFRELHEDLQQQPSTLKNKGLERIVVALMFWSDGTQLTSFGGASLWPCYLFFGNESKYRRAQPSQRLGYQVAYFIKLPDKLNDHLKDRNKGKLPTEALFTYCTRELFHKQWSILLDGEFQEAVKEGIVLACPDGKERCFYPRIITYAADYPEKMLIAGLRNNGLRPCHRCLIDKAHIFALGAPSSGEQRNLQRDKAQEDAVVSDCRKEIDKGYAVNSGTFEERLKEYSLYPVQSAFSNCLSMDISSTLVADILHEFEIGSWKKLFIHLIRLLLGFSSEQGVTLSAELDSRYRLTPAFSRDKIRKFPLNVSEMKRKAARDFENLLQCAIPSFESLLPEPHNAILLKLLYICAQWHALAKLRLHNDFTLAFLEYSTSRLGAQMRFFDRETCSSAPTKELPQEAEARARRETKKGKGKASTARKPVQLSMYTIKFHYLGDYANIIRKFGTTDSYSTQIGELYHRLPKSWYPRTDRKDYETQISQIERRQARLSNIRAELDSRTAEPEHLRPNKLNCSWREMHYTIGTNQNHPLPLEFFRATADEGRLDDTIGFMPSLKRHLLPRILQAMAFQGVATSDSWQHVVLKENRLYNHLILRLSYTTYDVQLDEDIVHVGTPQCNVMMLNSEFTGGTKAGGATHAYLYARVIGVFHADVSFAGPLSGCTSNRAFHRLDFVWIHWLQFLGSSEEFALDRVAPAPIESGKAFAFVDPIDIIRGVHLIPQFALGKVDPPPPEFRFIPSQVQWNAYYINKFADRDAFMRYQFGMSVGHAYMRGPAFPPPHVPTIPADFDWCLDVAPSDEQNSKDDFLDHPEAEGDEWDGRGDLCDVDDRDLQVFDNLNGDDQDRGY